VIQLTSCRTLRVVASRSVVHRQIWQPFPARRHPTVSGGPARDATIDSEQQPSFDIGYRLRWRNPLPGANIVHMQHSNPEIDRIISNKPRKTAGISCIVHSQHFLLETAGRHG